MRACVRVSSRDKRKKGDMGLHTYMHTYGIIRKKQEIPFYLGNRSKVIKEKSSTYLK